MSHLKSGLPAKKSYLKGYQYTLRIDETSSTEYFHMQYDGSFENNTYQHRGTDSHERV